MTVFCLHQKIAGYTAYDMKTAAEKLN